MLKISINVLGKDADNTLFTLPIQGIELSREELNRILGDRTFEAWYQQKPDKSWHPMDFWHARKNGSFEIDQEFTADALTITVSGNKDIEFETVEAEGDDDDDRPAATIDSLVFKPTAGGVTLLSLHLQVRPGLAQDNLALQKHQFRPVTITLSDVQQLKAKNAQQSLALGNGADETESNARASRTQAAPAVAKPGEVIDGRSERVKQQDRTRSREY